MTTNDQIHPDDLRRLAMAEQASQQQPPAAGRTDLNNLRRMVDETPEIDEFELAEKRRLRRRAAQKRLVTQKRKRLASTGDIWLTFQILLLILGLILERLFRDIVRTKGLFDHQSARVRGAILIGSAVVILLTVGVVVGVEMKKVADSKKGPFLADALASPYDLETRPYPALDEQGQVTMPGQFGEYRLSTTQYDPKSLSALNRCMVGVSVGYGSEKVYCSRTYGAASMGYGRYMDASNSPVDVIAARFVEDTQAAQTISELLQFTRSVSQVGNFSLVDDDQADYFYAVSVSDFYRWTSFVWRRGPWLFIVSTQSSGGLEAAIEAFPY